MGLLSGAHILKGFRYQAWWLFRIKWLAEVYRSSTCYLSDPVADLMGRCKGDGDFSQRSLVNMCEAADKVCWAAAREILTVYKTPLKPTTISEGGQTVTWSDSEVGPTLSKRLS